MELKQKLSFGLMRLPLKNKLIQTESDIGSLTAQIDNMLLHSSYNPEREANTAAQELTATNKETVIIMGAGLGWQI